MKIRSCGSFFYHKNKTLSQKIAIILRIIARFDFTAKSCLALLVIKEEEKVLEVLELIKGIFRCIWMLIILSIILTIILGRFLIPVISDYSQYLSIDWILLLLIILINFLFPLLGLKLWEDKEEYYLSYKEKMDFICSIFIPLLLLIAKFNLVNKGVEPYLSLILIMILIQSISIYWIGLKNKKSKQ